ncbi:hypothetical protein KFL_001120220 [Klebsormidium nitens]|uniref:DUF1499 domain-containing protein n=1 Tax=Klebsormidium nitens TaxID=105231 RepID=A0A1Y1I129_KLENI|nr:hypothetical protein KFL_001120220 [Klebsormidium nitens]|eukprot:GAQ82477.1 hypothetical protein KFL_001120220 [Klebsormidium nitens]
MAAATISRTLKGLTLKPSPNQYLVAPNGYTVSPSMRPAPSFRQSPKEVAEAWKKVAQQQVRTKLEGEDIEGKVVRTHHTQKSLIFRFADDIYADFIPENGRTSIAVYSASRVGYGDLGVNQKRVEAWLEELQKAVPPSK